jgi:23S rRNA (uracil1939-C5)-methyltransferase
MVREKMEEEGLVGIVTRETLGMEDPWFYRNKIQFPIREQNGKLQMGYFKMRTHEVVNIKECYIQDPFLTEIARIARGIFEDRGISAYDEETGKGILRHFIGRSSQKTGELLLGVVVNGRGLPAGFTVADEIKKQERRLRRQVSRHQEYPRFEKKMRIVGIVQNVNTARGNVIMGKQNTLLLGNAFMREKLGPFTFNVQLPSFFQVNPLQAEKLYNLVRKFAALSGGETVVDAYAGTGAIAFWLAEKARKVIAIEEREAAVKDVQKNIKLNALENVEVQSGMVEKVFPRKADVVVLDPPRGGCSEKAMDAAVKAGPGRIVYVSCNPETMARNLKVLSKDGYAIEAVQPVDMFPQTEHVEVVVRLSRRS